MIAGSLLFGLISMVSYGLANAFSLPLAKRLGPARMLLVRGVATCAFLTPVLLCTVGRVVDWRAALAAFAIGVLGYLPPLAFTHGIKVSRIGIVAPIAGTAPLFTVLLSALLLHTELHVVQWLGVVIVIAANVAVSIDLRNLRNSNLLKTASGVPFGLIAALLWGLVFFLIIYPTRSLGPWLSIFFLEVGVVVAAAVHVALRRESFMLRESLRLPLATNALLIAVGGLAYTIGVNAFNVGLVAALSNSTAVVSIIAASLVHHEHLTRNEKILAALLVAGVVLISVA